MNLTDLEKLLEARDAVVADRDHYEKDPEAHLQRLIEASEALNRWHETHREDLPPTLAHYLERQSYQKALAYCQGDTRHRV